MRRSDEARAKRRAYSQRPEVRERETAYMREYHRRPEVIARAKALRDRPEAKAKIAAYMKQYRQGPNFKANRARRLFLQRLKYYGLSEQQFQEMFARQGGKCAICGTSEFLNRGPQIDHEHSPASKVRGILCNSCNGGLGLFRDSIANMKAAIAYLEANQ